MPSRTVRSLELRRRASSIPISPNSLTITAVFRPASLARNLLIKVVFPEPRKPVTIVTGMRPAPGRETIRTGGCAFSMNGFCFRSKIHIEYIKTALVPVDGVDDLAFVDEYVVQLNRSRWG